MDCPICAEIAKYDEETMTADFVEVMGKMLRPDPNWKPTPIKLATTVRYVPEWGNKLSPVCDECAASIDEERRGNGDGVVCE